MPAERLQKILAQAGFGSRRVCEGFIKVGRVRVNGELATLGQKADIHRDEITLDGKRVVLSTPNIYIALYKPRFVLSTAKAEPGDHRETVLDLVELPDRIYPVGRLDFDSEGLVLLTNDGELANVLTHPRYGHEKEYKVLLARRPTPEQLRTWQRGVVLEDGHHTADAKVWFESASGKGAWVRIVMSEGRKRQIREIGYLLGLPVVRIIRVRIGSLLLGRLKPRQWRYLTAQEVSALKGLVK